MKPSASVYVETHAGWRAFFLCLLLAAVLGCGFRLYFSPTRLKAWVTAVLDRQKAAMAHPFALSFGEASLRLSDSTGYFPELAVVVRDVRVAPRPECFAAASVFIGELRLPFRVWTLLSSGRAAVGVIGARDVTVDLDGLRARCDGTGAAPAGAKPTVAETAVALAEPPAKDARAWWTPEQFETVRGFVEGLQFSRARLQYENKTKEIYLDSFAVRFNSDQTVSVRSEIRIPPTVTYGEQIPPLKLQGQATATQASVTVNASVSEGALTTEARLTPGPNETLQTEAKVSVKSLPLSLLSPLMRKSGMTNGRFAPKFMWLDCQATIAGTFQGLFQKNPLELKDCRIEGGGTDIRLAQATRTPEGSWKPFDVKVVSLDLAKLFDTVGVKGPEGVANEFGRLSGEVKVDSQDEARFTGDLKNARLYFSNRKIRASQLIETASVKIEVERNRINAQFANVQLANGSIEGKADFHLDRSLREGSADVSFANLKFDPEVQKVLTGGTLGAAEGALNAKIEDSRITDFEAKLRVLETDGTDYKFANLTARAERKNEDPPRVIIDAPVLKIKDSLYDALRPAFFAHELRDLNQAHVELTIEGAGDITWAKSHATSERNQIQIASSGSMDRDHVVSANLQIDYPKIKHLKWTVRGPLVKPVLKGASEEVTQLKARAEIDDKVLGIQ